ncbi:MAG: hypothetical protein AB7K68_15270 [Bacteriovoracia bacterium]
MNIVSGIFVALAVVFGGGYALEKVYATLRQVTVERIYRGQPSLERFTNQLTCAKISKSGNLRPLKCKRH